MKESVVVRPVAKLKSKARQKDGWNICEQRVRNMISWRFSGLSSGFFLLVVREKKNRNKHKLVRDALSHCVCQIVSKGVDTHKLTGREQSAERCSGSETRRADMTDQWPDRRISGRHAVIWFEGSVIYLVWWAVYVSHITRNLHRMQSKSRASVEINLNYAPQTSWKSQDGDNRRQTTESFHTRYVSGADMQFVSFTSCAKAKSKSHFRTH